MSAPPKPPSHDEREALIKEARARQLRRRQVGAAGVVIVTALGLSVYGLTAGPAKWSSTGGNARPQAVLPCSAAGGWRLAINGDWSEPTGEHTAPVRITRTGARPCALERVPNGGSARRAGPEARLPLQPSRRHGRRSPVAARRPCWRRGLGLLPPQQVPLRPPRRGPCPMAAGQAARSPRLARPPATAVSDDRVLPSGSCVPHDRRLADRSPAHPGHRPASVAQSGMLPCLRRGRGSAVVSDVSSASMSTGRVRRGSITSST
jgi:hypothetical protein